MKHNWLFERNLNADPSEESTPEVVDYSKAWGEGDMSSVLEDEEKAISILPWFSNLVDQVFY